MSDWHLTTPVAFLIFNRPETTARVFEMIRMARPPKLLVVADGPRANRKDDAENCKAARAVVERVDWPCEVMKNYSELNLGCKERVSSGLDWVFRTVPEAIVLEDDCLAHLSFFRFCEELLAQYREDDRILMISGDNFQFGRRSRCSYYFSQYPHIWGWASWRRAWRHYDVNMRLWPEIRDSGWLQGIFASSAVEDYWRYIFEKVYSGEINTWDYQWTFSLLVQHGLAIVPNTNLVSNIGFGVAATHTQSNSRISRYAADMATDAMKFPLIHPEMVIRAHFADNYTEKTIFPARTLRWRLYSQIRRLMR